MSVNTNGSALRYEAALKDKDIITQIIQENRDIDLAYNALATEFIMQKPKNKKNKKGKK